MALGPVGDRKALRMMDEKLPKKEGEEEQLPGLENYNEQVAHKQTLINDKQDLEAMGAMLSH